MGCGSSSEFILEFPNINMGPSRFYLLQHEIIFCQIISGILAHASGLHFLQLQRGKASQKKPSTFTPRREKKKKNSDSVETWRWFRSEISSKNGEGNPNSTHYLSGWDFLYLDRLFHHRHLYKSDMYIYILILLRFVYLHLKCWWGHLDCKTVVNWNFCENAGFSVFIDVKFSYIVLWR